MSLGAGGLEDDLYLVVVEHRLDALVGGLDPLVAGPFEAL
jgi:hypothetical protein